MSKKAEKTSVEKLTEELLINRKNGFMDVTDEQVKKAALFHLTERLLIKRETKYIITIEISL